MSQQSQPPVKLFVGIDWADQTHDYCAIFPDGKVEQGKLRHSIDEIEAWIEKMLKRVEGGAIAIHLEQARGPLFHALIFRENVVLYPVNPKQFARYRESYPGGDGKNDPADAYYLACMLQERISQLTAWQPNDQDTRLLDELSRQRRAIVDSQTKLRQQLVAHLKSCFPLLLELFGKSSQLPLLLTMVKRWPDPRELRRANPKWVRKALEEHSIRNPEQQDNILQKIRSSKLLCQDSAVITATAMTLKLLAQQIEQCIETVKDFDKQIKKILKRHPDGHLFTSLEGAGPTLAARLLCAFGSQKDRWENADQLASLSGIAPVTRQSGKQRFVHRRFACPKYLRQTFHEFADSSRKWCPWSQARYRQLKADGMKHHAALRKIARS